MRPAHSPCKPEPDQDARDALAWLDSGMPEADVNYTEDAPRLSKEQLGEFRPARFRIPRRG